MICSELNARQTAFSFFQVGFMAERILVIDDDPVQRVIVASALADYDVTGAESGEEGLTLFQSQPFDLVICDLMLPGVGGLDVMRKLRQVRPEQRIMVLSAFGTKENLVASLREQVIDFVVKPVDAEQLRNVVRDLLSCERSIEVISATQKWIELRVPARFQVASSLQNFLKNLQAEVDDETREKVSMAFRELINNAIEHGCKGDLQGMLLLSYVRLSRGILFRLQDPGRGFNLGAIPHAAVSNPPNDVFHHLEIREKMGMRAGGFGLSMISLLADELVYSERGNDVLFIKYLDT